MPARIASPWAACACAAEPSRISRRMTPSGTIHALDGALLSMTAAIAEPSNLQGIKMIKQFVRTAIVAALFIPISAFPASHSAPAASGGRAPSSGGAKVYFIAPKDGETIKGPVKVVMGLSGMGIAPAGIDMAETGHHHLLVDAGAPAFDKPIASDDNHRHFGKGQTETSLKLAPGKHTLQLLLGDKTHIPHEPALVSDRITITVKE